MWFVMTLLVFGSLIGSILYLVKGEEKWDILAHESAVVALLFGTCGYLTGLIWAKYTWYIGTDWLDVMRKTFTGRCEDGGSISSYVFLCRLSCFEGAINRSG